MARNYYTLVAGLREFTIDSEKKGFDACDIIAEIRSEIDREDKRTLGLFYDFYDVENLINLRTHRGRFNQLGNYSREELEEGLKDPAVLPDFIGRIVAAYADPENPEYDWVDPDISFERALFISYYRECAGSKNRYLREWYEFDRNLRNVIAAYNARKASLDVGSQLVGEGYVRDALTRSSAADFGLRGELDYVDDVIDALAEEENILGKERKIDLIRWRISEELTPYDYFNMNTILSYLTKINIVHRWVSLDEGYGREMLRKLMASLDGKNLIEKAV
ncbi:MAG: DUF2764 domain-containing protein [Rikenellaceae bacterium]|nr:DUF2764 domain-containing protein [Rikenellaceae bacterium]